MRPKKPKREQKGDLIRFRVTADQRAAIEAAAARDNLDLSAWVRFTLLKAAAGDLVPRPPS